MSREPEGRAQDGGHRAGVVALLGRPNAGKSTLLNRLVGEKVAIVTAKPQTTRSRILGIVSRPDAQLLLMDTPGFHEGSRALNRALGEIVDEVAADCDVALLLVDPREGWSQAHEALCERLARRGTPLLVVATKADAEAGRDLDGGRPADLAVSARTGEGVEALLDAVVRQLPVSPPLHDPELLTDRPLRFLAAELVREAAFEELAQEVPYETAVEIREFDERSRPDLVTIRADLLVERPSQKGIVLGRGGARIKAIGQRARAEIERLLDRRVHLELWVKVERHWTRKPKRLKSLGYS